MKYIKILVTAFREFLFSFRYTETGQGFISVLLINEFLFNADINPFIRLKVYNSRIKIAKTNKKYLKKKIKTLTKKIKRFNKIEALELAYTLRKSNKGIKNLKKVIKFLKSETILKFSNFYLASIKESLSFCVRLLYQESIINKTYLDACIRIIIMSNASELVYVIKKLSKVKYAKRRFSFIVFRKVLAQV